MKRFIACLVGAALSAAAADLAALATPASAEQFDAKPPPPRNWSEDGRWLVPYEMAGYTGYKESAPSPKTAQQTTPK